MKTGRSDEGHKQRMLKEGAQAGAGDPLAITHPWPSGAGQNKENKDIVSDIHK